ncbi:MAG: enoyl-CoA hydratase/isomerase family protein [Ilumatobacteraceae bacterium]
MALLLGPLAAKRHLLLGEPLGAEDALRLGVAAEVCPGAEVAQRAMAWAQRLAAGAPIAVQGTKQAINAQLKQALLTSFDLSTALEIPCIMSADHAEAVDAFVAGRPPVFEGR